MTATPAPHWLARRLPPPGSFEARSRGCQCKGFYGNARNVADWQWVLPMVQVSERCGLHGNRKDADRLSTIGYSP
jgi:hypothetical protein